MPQVDLQVPGLFNELFISQRVQVDVHYFCIIHYPVQAFEVDRQPPEPLEVPFVVRNESVEIENATGVRIVDGLVGMEEVLVAGVRAKKEEQIPTHLSIYQKLQFLACSPQTKPIFPAQLLEN